MKFAARGLLGLGARFPRRGLRCFTLRLRRGCLVLTVARHCRFVRCESRGCRRLVRARAALACATAPAPSAPAPTAAATAAFGALAFSALGAVLDRGRCDGYFAGCILLRRLGGVAVTVTVAFDPLALGSISISRALGRALATALCGRPVTATAVAVAVAIPIAVLAPTIPVATLAAAIALASGTVAMTRIARMLAPSLAPLTLIAPCGARGRGDARFGRGLGRRRGGSFAGQDSLDA